jgi:phenylacetic acid degradation operon negative regulatory protein
VTKPAKGQARVAHGASGSELTTPAAKLLMTILGDYWFGSLEYVPSSALVSVLGELGVGRQAARAAFSRLSREGRIERIKVGRHTAYRLAEAARAASTERGRALRDFGAAPVEWDGRWTCVAFSVPESDRHRRAALRVRLRALRMGLLFDGLWISPRSLVAEIERALDEVGVAEAVVFRAAEVRGGRGRDLLDAWDLTTLRAGFAELTDALDVIEGELHGGTLSPAAALVARTDLMARWRTLAGADPYLPDELLPADWPLAEARRRFVSVYAELGPLSELRVRQVTGIDESTTTGAGPRHHRLADLS